MNQLKVVLTNGQLVTESRDVAKMVNREHNGLMKSIRSYIEFLAEGDFDLSQFFIKSSYVDANNQTRPCFLITRKGCDMVANKMTGSKGVLFTAEYVTRFEEMEKELSEPKTEIQILQRAVNSLADVDNRVSYLEDHMRIDGIQEKKLKDKAKSIAIESLGGTKSSAYKKISRKVFSGIWRDFNNHFQLPRYSELPRKQFEDGLRFLGMWQPNTSLRIEIEELNTQQTIHEVM